MVGDIASRVSVIELSGYREWTEEQGPDREWRIQITQARVYAAAQEAAAEYGGFVLPVRYDYMLVLSSGMSRLQLKKVLDAVARVSPVPVRMGSACSPTPLAAEEAAFALLQDAGPGRVEYEECKWSEGASVAHIDLNNVTGLTLRLGAYKAYRIVLEVAEKISGRLTGAGGIIQYLGGDNLLAVLPTSNEVYEIVSEAVSFSDLKAGIGVAKTYRRALALAADALHEIRAGLVKDRVYAKIG